jgi:hypothetical protein
MNANKYKSKDYNFFNSKYSKSILDIPFKSFNNKYKSSYRFTKFKIRLKTPNVVIFFKIPNVVILIKIPRVVIFFKTPNAALNYPQVLNKIESVYPNKMSKTTLIS